MYEPPKCRKCGRVIAFIPTRNGKQMPVDGFAVYIQPWNRGSVFYSSNGELLRGTKCVKGDKGAIQAYQSHYATCPAADEIRKTKTRSARNETVKRIVERERQEEARKADRREAKARAAREKAEAEEAQTCLFATRPAIWR